MERRRRVFIGRNSSFHYSVVYIISLKSTLVSLKACRLMSCEVGDAHILTSLAVIGAGLACFIKKIGCAFPIGKILGQVKFCVFEPFFLAFFFSCVLWHSFVLCFLLSLMCFLATIFAFFVISCNPCFLLSLAENSRDSSSSGMFTSSSALAERALNSVHALRARTLRWSSRI